MTFHDTLTVSLPSGQSTVRLGQGTWNMGESPLQRKAEIAALRCGIELGLTLIDTAEMYADGGAEIIVGEAIKGLRDRIFLVSKVLPGNASRDGTINACEQSLKRLKTDYLDLYLLHWRSGFSLHETVEAFDYLCESGKIGSWGVSNFDFRDMNELFQVETESTIVTNQVLYNVSRRGIEFDLLPLLQSRTIPVMAYSPIEQGRSLKDETLNMIARRHNASAAQIALAWTLRNDNVIAIPKSSKIEHVQQNRAAMDIILTKEDLADIDAAFPPPVRPSPLEVL